MKRYLETLFRYWYIALLPVVVLPVAMYAIGGHPPVTYHVYTTVRVEQSPADNQNYYRSPADNESDDFNESIKTPDFVQAVVSGIPQYQSIVGNGNALTDFSQNLSVGSVGPHTLQVGYTTTDPAMGFKLVQSIVNQQHVVDQENSTRQAAYSLQVAQRQFASANRALQAATKTFVSYLVRRDYSRSDVPSLMNDDPTLAALYNQVQTDQANQKNAGAALSQAQADKKSAEGSVLQQSNYYLYGGEGYYRLSVKKKVLMNLALALVVGLVISGAFIIVKTLLDRTIRLAEEVPTMLGLPVLTMLPYSDTLATHRIGTPRAVATVPPRGLLLDG